MPWNVIVYLCLSLLNNVILTMIILLYFLTDCAFKKHVNYNTSFSNQLERNGTSMCKVSNSILVLSAMNLNFLFYEKFNIVCQCDFFMLLISFWVDSSELQTVIYFF
jgi:hypothetical protein